MQVACRLFAFKPRLTVRRPFSMLSSDAHLWKKVTVQGGEVDIFSGEIEQSPNDDRQYRLIRLKNGLQAMLVHDPKADKAAAALDVAVGHLSDPDDMPGLAHFCEHLLFMGTEQFPRENDYGEFIAANGGSTNAYTAASNTNYHFSVSPSHLQGALERFSGFFHTPLFEPSCTSRELNAVDSEHKKNRQQDSWRLFQLGKGLSTDGHAWKKFGSGNRETLLAAGRLVSRQQKSANGKPTLNNDAALLTPRGPSPAPSTGSASDLDGGAAGRETRRRLIEWWTREYCAGRMKLAVMGQASLEDLTNMVTRFFSPVPNRNQEPLPLIQAPPLGKEQVGTIVFAKSIMDLHLLEIAFGVPYQAPHYRSKPGNFLSHILGHEGPGSIHSYLKSQGYLLSLEAGCTPLGRGFDAFRLTLTLTPHGIQNWREVVKVIYKYINLLKHSSILPYHHDEMRTMSDIRFRFKEKRPPLDYVTSIAEGLQQPYPPSLTLSASSRLWEWDEKGVRAMLDYLSVEKGRIMLVCKDHDGLAPSKEWMKEEWYGTEYQVHRLDQLLTEEAASVDYNLRELLIPDPNPFIPTNLEVLQHSIVEPISVPIMVKDTQTLSLWYRAGELFSIPKANIAIRLKSSLAASTAANAVMTRLASDLIIDSLTEYAYDAELAGLRYGISADMMGLQVVIGGYNDKIHVLLRKVLECVKNFTPTAPRLDVMKHNLMLEYRNFDLNHPFRIADYWMKYVLQRTAWTKTELMEEIQGCNIALLKEHINRLVSELHLEVLVHGNMTQASAIDTANIIEDVLTPQTLPLENRPFELSLILPSESNTVWIMEGPNVNDVNSSLSYYCHVGNVTDKKLRSVLGLFAHIAHEPCFDQLRTKEQLGYIVASSVWQATESIGWRVVIQSERQPSYLEDRVDAFLDILKSKLETITDEEFNQHREGLITQKLERPKNLGEEMNQIWFHIQSGYNDFTRRLEEAELLREVRKEDVLEFFLLYIWPGSIRRRKLSIHCKSAVSASVKLTVEAAEAFSDDLREAHIPFDADQFVLLAAKEPPLDVTVTHWKGVLSEVTTVDEDTKARLISRLILHCEKYSPDEGVTSRPTIPTAASPVVLTSLEDVLDFKSKLTVSGPPMPVQNNSSTTSRL